MVIISGTVKTTITYGTIIQVKTCQKMLLLNTLVLAKKLLSVIVNLAMTKYRKKPDF